MRSHWLLAVCCIVSFAGCNFGRPSNTRNWRPDQSILPYAEVEGDVAHVHNVRNCKYLGATEYLLAHYDKKYDLSKLDTVDFIIVPFTEWHGAAHTFLSFGFGGEEYLAVSVEIRREEHEQYSLWKSLNNEYEIMYVLGDERDLIGLRANFRKDEVYVYRAKADPEKVRKLFLDILDRTNDLVDHPEFYHLFMNNCTTNVVNHVNRVSPNRVTYNLQVMFPGYSDRFAYELGLLDTKLSFAETKRRAHVNTLAKRYADEEKFSQKIRQPALTQPGEKETQVARVKRGVRR